MLISRKILLTTAIAAVTTLFAISCPARVDDVNITEAKSSGIDYSFIVWKIDMPESLTAGETALVPVELINNGKKAWGNEVGPYFLSYHWKHPGGQFDGEMFWGEKTELPTPIGPGEVVSVEMAVKAPQAPKFYVITIDIMRDRETDRQTGFWFEERGWKTFDMLIEVAAR